MKYTIPPVQDPQSSASMPICATSASTFRDAVARARQRVAAGIPHAIFVIRVERLRDATEHCGHEAGLVLLEKIDRLLVREAGPWNADCRPSVDQIAILKQDCRRRDAIALAHRICNVLNAETFCWHDLTFRVGATIGVLELEEQPEGIDDLLGRATEACDAARSLGNDGVLVFTGHPGEREAVERERAWREHISETLV